jgi:hypothetical protein
MEMNQTFCYCPVIKNLQQTSTTSTNGYFDSTSTRDKLIVIDALIKVASKFGLSDDEINIFSQSLSVNQAITCSLRTLLN